MAGKNRIVHLSLSFLRWFCPPDLYEGIEGDLLEKFQEDSEVVGEKKAGKRMVWSVIKFFRSGIIGRNRFSNKFITTIMLGSYFKITTRALRKSWEYSLINIVGLAIGITSCMLIYSYVRFEQSFDLTHPDVDQLYRVNQTAIWTPGGGVMTSSGPQLAFALQQDYPEVEQAVRINTVGDAVVSHDDAKNEIKTFRESFILAADSNFFSFFDFKLKEGNPRTALVGKNKVVISAETAKKFFGDQPALGKILQFGADRKALEVSGVTDPQPLNTHFHFDYMLSIFTNENMKEMEWSFIYTQVVTYVKLRPHTDVIALEGKIQDLAEKRVAPSFKRLGMDFNDFVRDKGGWHFYLQPVKDIRLGSGSISQRFEEVGDRTYVYILAGVAGFILLIAAINFINLSTARATMRAKEVGVKKTLGALRSSLVAQFQFESIFISILATILAVVLAELFRPIIFQLTGFDLPFSLSGNWQLVGVIVLFPIVLGFVAGIYPSFYLTAFQPIQTLKGKLASGMKSSGLRNGLVTLQFTIAIALMSATLLVFQQLNYVMNKNLGLDKENILLISHAHELGPQLESFRNEIASYEGVVDATVTTQAPGSDGAFEDIFSKKGSTENLPINQAKVDNHFFSSFGITLLTGRLFKEGNDSDKSSIILNENAAKLFGWSPEEAIGKYVVYPGDGPQDLEVIGVVKDFHFRSLREPITPILFLTLNSTMWGNNRMVAVKFNSGDISKLMSHIEDRWKQLAPAAPVEFEFYDESLARQYQNERKLSRLFAVFACFSIAVGIIGLIGLVAYSTEQRKKEIGIRKVFGASSSKIIVLMNSQYIKLIIVALFLATPFAWWMVQQWLNSFAFHITIHPVVFVLAGVFETLLALACVGYLSLRAATLNPAAVLKDE